MLRITCTLLFTIAGALFAIGQSGPSYKIRQLEILRGGSGFARALNLQGAAAGSFGHPHGSDMTAVLWSQRQKTIDLGRLPGGDHSEAYGINDSGIVVGVSNTASAMQPFVWDGDLRQLALPAGDTSGLAYAINNRGQIAGWTSGPGGMHAVIWEASGQVQNLPGNHGQALALNNDGAAAGSARVDGREHAALWIQGNIEDLDVLPGHSDSRALAINDARQVVGWSAGITGQRAFIWSPATEMRDLGVLSGGDYSEASDLNENGVVVGTSKSSLGKRAFIWSASSGMRDLNTLVPDRSNLVLTAALAINDRGQILAIGSPGHGSKSKKRGFFDHNSHAGAMSVYLLTPVK